MRRRRRRALRGGGDGGACHVTPRTGRASSFGQLCPARPVSGRLAAAPRPASLQGDGRLLVLRMRARDTIADVIAAAAAAMLVPHHVTR